VSLLIVGLGGRVPGFNFGLAGWFICSLLLAVMVFTVKNDLRRLEEHTAAAMDRRRRMMEIGSVVDIDKVDSDNPQAMSATVSPSDEDIKTEDTEIKSALVVNVNDVKNEDLKV
jgi:hypothetical protein